MDQSESVDPGAREEEPTGGRRFPTLDIRYVQVCYSPGEGLQHVIVHAQPLLQGKGMASRRPGNCRASAIYKEGAELVVDARGRRRSSAASSVDEYL